MQDLAQCKPLVSVIINTYNSATYLGDAIRSVLASDYKNFELIVWDNQSTDNTKNLVGSFKDDRIKYIYAPRHTELGEARNLALDHVRGEYVGFCDADDMWGVQKISKQVDFFQTHPTTVAVFSDCDIINSQGEKTGVYSDRVKNFSGRVTEKILMKCYLVLSACLVQTSVLKQVGKFPNQYSYIEEYECWLKMSLLGEIHVLPERLTIYREHVAQKSRDLMLRYRETDSMIKEFRTEQEWHIYDRLLSFSLIKASLHACRYAVKEKKEFGIPLKTLWHEFWKYPVNHVKLLTAHVVKGI